MPDEAFMKKMVCDVCGQPRIVRAIKLEKPGMIKSAVSEGAEEELRKQAAEATDPDDREVFLMLAEGQKKYRELGHLWFKVRCLEHPTEVDASLYPNEFDEHAQIIHENFLRCGKCGNTVEVVESKGSGKKTVLKIQCSEHGMGKREVPTHFIESLMNPPTTATPTKAAPVAEPQPVKPEPKPESKPEPKTPVTKPKKVVSPPPAEKGAIAFCWKCGEKTLRSDSEFCHKCGSSLTG